MNTPAVCEFVNRYQPTYDIGALAPPVSTAGDSLAETSRGLLSMVRRAVGSGQPVTTLPTKRQRIPLAIRPRVRSAQNPCCIGLR
jgi:hypothetical protein